VCLKCGTNIKRGGGEFYRERHWESKHNHEAESLSKLFIVSSDHEDAIKCKKTSKCSSEQTKQARTFATPSASVISKKPLASSSVTADEPELSIQKSLGSSLNDKPSPPNEDTLENIQSGVN